MFVICGWRVGLLVQGLPPLLQLMKLQTKIALTATLVEGEDLFPNSNFLNMPPCELSTLDVTGLPCLEALCVCVCVRERVCAKVSLTREHENNGRVVLVIFVWATFLKADVPQKTPNQRCFFGVIRREANTLCGVMSPVELCSYDCCFAKVVGVFKALVE